MNYIKKTLILSALIILAFTLKGQNILMNAANNGQTFTGCSMLICDSGDTTSTYGNSETSTISFTSNDPLLPGIALKFIKTFDIEENDTLWIFDGDGSSPSQLISGGLHNKTYFNASNPVPSGFIFKMTAANTSHKITLKFKSNESVVGVGFAIKLTCSRICQSVYAKINATSTTPQPDTNYIAICPWDTAKIVAHGYYPMNDTMAQPFYHQRDATSTFNWDFGDGTTQSGLNLSTVHHNFPAGKGYEVLLTIIDSAGCQSTNTIGLRVMTSKNPISEIRPLTDICSGKSIDLKVGYEQNSNIHILPFESTQTSSQTFADTTFIPDGTCNGSNCYNTFVTFTSFSPTQTIQSQNDILSLCINMEHSYVGDLDLEFVCPNGQVAKLMSTTAVQQHGSAQLGWEAVGTNDDEEFICDPTKNPPGNGFIYCWSQIPTYSYHGTLHANSYNGSVEATDTTNHSNYLVPEQPFSSLIGCPLYGTWYIKICDLWGGDNGYVFDWTLKLDPSLLPEAWSYEVKIDSVSWSGTSITPTSDTSATITSQIEDNGTSDYHFSIMDNFGCAYDSIIKLNVVQTPTPNLGNDTSFCEETILILDPHYGIPGSKYAWSDFTNDHTMLAMTPNTYMVTVTNKSANQSVQCFGYDTIIVTNYPQPNPNFTPLLVEGCTPLMVQFKDATTPENPNYTYEWIFEDPASQTNTSTDKNPQHLYTQDGTFDITLSVTSPEGCSASLTKPDEAKIHPTPVASFTATPPSASLSDNPTITFINETGNYIPEKTTWLWNFKDNSTSPNFNESHTYTKPGNYEVYLVARNINGCSDTAYRTIIIEEDLFIPNIITPDGDNINDILVIGNLNTNNNNILKIYDRWGKKIYEKNNYSTTTVCKKMDTEGKSWICENIINADQGWDGEGCADGVYFYTFHYEGASSTVDKHGTITLIGGK